MIQGGEGEGSSLLPNDNTGPHNKPPGNKLQNNYIATKYQTKLKLRDLSNVLPKPNLRIPTFCTNRFDINECGAARIE